MGAWRQGWRRITVAGHEGWRTIIKNASWSRFRTLCEREEATINVISTFSFGSYAVFKFHTSAPKFTRLVNAVEKIASVQAPSALEQQETKEKEKDALAALPSSPEQSQTSEETKENDAPALPSQSQPSEVLDDGIDAYPMLCFVCTNRWVKTSPIVKMVSSVMSMLRKRWCPWYY